MEVGNYLSFQMTNNLFNVDDTNNKIYINENGTDKTITLIQWIL